MIGLYVASASLSLNAATVQDEQSGYQHFLAPFDACLQITDTAARLTCYEEAHRSLRGAVAEQIARDERAAEEQFGLASRGGNGREEVGFEGVEADLREIIVIDRSGRRLFVLDNGQVWRELSNTNLRGTLKEGTSISIKEGGIGGYRLRADGHMGFISVSRVN